jgi:hypothetical protein
MWDQNLTWLQLAFNTAEHESTKAAPFLVIFPFRTGSPLINQWKINELIPERFNRKVLKHKWLAVKQNLLKSQASMALRYNCNHVLKPFKVGDLVYYRNHPISHTGCQITAKLLHRWKGPFRVGSFLIPVRARLVDPATGNFVTGAHVSMLKSGSRLHDWGIYLLSCCDVRLVWDVWYLVGWRLLLIFIHILSSWVILIKWTDMSPVY